MSRRSAPSRAATASASCAPPRPTRTVARIDHDDAQGPLLLTSCQRQLEPLTAARAAPGACRRHAADDAGRDRPHPLAGAAAVAQARALLPQARPGRPGRAARSHPADRVPDHDHDHRLHGLLRPDRRLGPAGRARGVRACCSSCRSARSTCNCPTAAQARFGHGAAGEPHAAVRLHDWSVCGAALKRGDIGFAETFIAGGWSTPDLTALLQAASSPTARRWNRWSTAAGGARCCTACATCSTATRARAAAQHPRPLRPRQRVLPAVARRDHDLLQRAVRRRRHAAPPPMRSAPRCAARSRECAVQPGDRRARDRLRLGWLGRDARCATAARASPASRCRPSSSTSARARIACAGRRRPRRPAPAGLPRHRRRPVRRDRLDRDVRGGRPRILGQLLRARCATSSSPAGAPASRRSRSATTCSTAT